MSVLSNQPNRVIVTLGDPAGMGWQALKKILRSPERYLGIQDQKKVSDIVVVGDIIKGEELVIKKKFHLIESDEENLQARLEEAEQKNENFPKKDQTKKPVFLALRKIESSPGKPTLMGARRSYQYMQAGINLWYNTPNSSLLTLPVSKEQILKSGIHFTGHTEELGKKYATDTFMCMYHPTLSVIPLTGHVPLKKAPSKVKKVDFTALAKALDFFLRFFGPKNPIAMLGLNPHAGEGGRIGKEEFFLKEKLNLLKKSKIQIEGLFPADGFFLPAGEKKIFFGRRLLP